MARTVIKIFWALGLFEGEVVTNPNLFALLNSGH